MMALIRRDMKIAGRGGSGALAGLLFYLAVVMTVPLALGPDLAMLGRIGPAVLWLGALLASLLTLDRLFQTDAEDGSLDILLAGDAPVLAIVWTKCIAHWLVSGLPLVLAAPLFGLMLAMAPAAIAATTLTLLIGTPAITMIGAAGAAVTVFLPRGGLLVAILIMPLVVPILIFGVAAASSGGIGAREFPAPFLFLSALTLFFGVLGPFAASLALKGSGE